MSVHNIINSVKHVLSEVLAIPTIPENWLQVIENKDNQYEIHFKLPFFCNTWQPQWQQAILAALSNDKSLKVNGLSCKWQSEVIAQEVPAGIKTVPQVKNIIAVASGKGGVGKSTVTTNLAIALMQQGARVGILDADIYGPNQPNLLGITEKPQLQGKALIPMVKYDIQSMSIGYLLDTVDTPVIWRGPMVSGALQQLLNETLWHELDYLLIDMPPGTGDIQLTLAQKIPVSGSIVVTTPQDLALLDVQKAVAMFKKVMIPILGVVENMAYYHCPNCQHIDPIFGEDGAKQMASQFNLDSLGTLPLNTEIRRASDAGVPIAINEPESPLAKLYAEIAVKMAARLAVRAATVKKKFPKIVVER
jgi:ATP-binding protein involved in chromosome partitioning